MAQPFIKAGKWYARFRDRYSAWHNTLIPARTKSEARRLNDELQIQEDRIRLGLDAPPQKNTDTTFASMVQWWLENRLAQTAAFSRCGGTVRRHLLEGSLAKLPPEAISPGKVAEFLSSKVGQASPSTINHLRAYIRTIFNAARGAERFHGENPVTRDVKKRRVPKRKPQYLHPHEVVPVLDAVAPQWKAVLATGIYAGLRKGEILGLQKTDVDLDQRIIVVRRSHDSETTKGGHEDGIPIAAELLPYLQDAMAASTSEYVFPREDGTRYPEGTDLVSVIRTALRRAQIVEGYVHKCRRHGCGFSVETVDGAQRRCPKCNMKLWSTAKVRPIRFHDTRHTTASLLIMFGANPAAVQKILRHTDVRITVDVYGHLAPDYLRTEIDRLSFRAPEPAEQEPIAAVATATAVPGPNGAELVGFASQVLPGPQTRALEPVRHGTENLAKSIVKTCRGGRIRTDDILLPNSRRRCRRRYQPFTTACNCSGSRAHHFPSVTSIHRFFQEFCYPRATWWARRTINTKEVPCPAHGPERPSDGQGGCGSATGLYGNGLQVVRVGGNSARACAQCLACGEGGSGEVRR